MAGLLGTDDRRSPGQDRIDTTKLVTIVSGHGGGVVTADTVNLGAGGMFLATDTSFDIGDRFICRIDLGEPYKPVLSGAEVRWIGARDSARGVGVRFLDIAKAAESLSGEMPVKGPELVRVRLPTVGQALEAEVVERAGKTVVVELDLPFFEPGTKVEVGPDVAARTAKVRRASWVGDGSSPRRIQLEMEVEPASVEVAAGQVVAEGNRRKAAQKLGFWQLPAKLMALRTRSEEEPMEAETEATARDLEAEARKREREEALEARRAEAARRARDEAEAERKAAEKAKAEQKAAEKAKAEQKAVEKAEATQRAQEEAEATTRSHDEEDREESIEADAEGRDDAESSAASEAETSKELPKRSTAGAGERVAADDDAADESSEVDEEFGPGAFSPITGHLEKILGAAVMARVLVVWGKAARWVGERINGPKLRAAASWCAAKVIAGARWVAARTGPALDHLWRSAKKLALYQRGRKQTRGEPSSVVQQLTSRARKVASRRGRTAALIIFLSLGALGLAAAGYGLLSSSSAEEEREGVQQEAESSGWTTGRWAEPEPVDPASNS